MIKDGEALCFGQFSESDLPPQLRTIGRATDPRFPLATFKVSSIPLVREDIGTSWKHIDRSIYPFDTFAVEFTDDAYSKFIMSKVSFEPSEIVSKLNIHLKKLIFSYDGEMHTICGVFGRIGLVDSYIINKYRPDFEEDSLHATLMSESLLERLGNVAQFPLDTQNPIVITLGFLLTILNDRCTSFIVHKEAVSRQLRRALEREGKEPAIVIELRSGVSYDYAMREATRVQKHLERMNPRRHSVSGHLRRLRDADGNVRKIVEIDAHVRGGKSAKMSRIYDASKLTERRGE